MPENLTYKILKAHLIEGELKPGNEIAIKIDQTLTQDATGTMAYLQFESLGMDKVKTELSVSYVDHNTLQQGFENADDHLYLQTIAQKYGIYFSRPGNGICHQVHLERFAAPGKTLLGSDSHTPTCGGLGMIAIGAGGLDVASAMAGGAFYLVAPKVVNIIIKGDLRKGVSAKDVILTVLSIIGTKGNVNTVLEYTGDGVMNLSVPERATIANMGAETGVTTSVFCSDIKTEKFLKAQGRADKFVPLSPDKDAVYDSVIEIELSSICPMVALPDSPGNVVPIKDIAGKKVDQVAIGSCTNSSLKDLKIVAAMLKDKKVHPGTSLIVAPGSKQVFSMIARTGDLAVMIDSGARIMESACGFCIGNGQAPKTGAVSVRTNNRNFKGRSGTESAGIYLVSPESAALAAVYGEFIDPLSVESSVFPDIKDEPNFLIDDGMIIAPEASSKNIEIIRGPNIGNPPKNVTLSDRYNGNIAIKLGDKITTDHIMPAGVRLKYRSNIEKYSEFVFEGVDPDFSSRAAALRDNGKAVFIVAGESYGQGSSREHAALCPMYLGVKAIISRSFERIHAANLVNFGILPLVFVDNLNYESLEFGDELVINDIILSLDNDSDLIIENKTKMLKIPVTYHLTQRQKSIIKAGGLLNYIKK
ncbi:MAG: aconitate hydratase [Candidatus Omnitrophica bacterium]|nr:aconitate hydratase [Candidatus Omnitrophota bacterium]MDD5081441.1 aconitate hydratase [Candidatus Omnitrophota bacterium]